MQLFVNELTTKTQIFWELSQVWNGRTQVELETGTAIDICNTLQNQLNPNRPIFRITQKLLDEIIAGEGHQAATSKILPFAKPVKKARKARS